MTALWVTGPRHYGNTKKDASAGSGELIGEEQARQTGGKGCFMHGQEHVQKHRSKGEKAGPKLAAGGTNIEVHTPSPLGACSPAGKADWDKAILIMSGECNDDFWVTHRDVSFPGQCSVQSNSNGQLVVQTIHLQVMGVVKFISAH